MSLHIIVLGLLLSQQLQQIRLNNVYVVVQFYPWFKFSFLLFLGMVMYDNNMIMSLKQKKRKFEPGIKLNHNIYKTQRRLKQGFDSTQ